MNTKEAQAKITTAISADAESIISKAIAFTPSTAAIVAEVRKVHGPITGVASAALRHALRGSNNAETEANMLRFAGTL